MHFEHKIAILSSKIMPISISFRHQSLKEEADGSKIICFRNCRLFREGVFIQQSEQQELWIRNGRVIEPLKIFYEERKRPTLYVDCHGLILAPGFIDIQVNGAFGVDFTTMMDGSKLEEAKEQLNLVAQRITQYGVTGFCPTIITAPAGKYKNFLELLKTVNLGHNLASILGAHFEGPFISNEKCGCHPKEFIIQSLTNVGQQIDDVYGDDLSKLSIVTLAPELNGANEAINLLCQKGVRVSIGHSIANMEQSEGAVNHGANCITHLFNQTTFHHREPGIFGVLANDDNNGNISSTQLFYGLIADGMHVSKAAIQMAFSTNSDGVILVTDCISALGFPNGSHQIGCRIIEINGDKAFIQGTNIMAGSIASMLQCLRFFASCITKLQNRNGLLEAVKAATYNPAKFLGIGNRKGTLMFGSDADFVLIDDQFNLSATFIHGVKCYEKE